MADPSSKPLSVEEHRNRILAAVSPLPPAMSPLSQALGRTLAVDVQALVDVPGFDNSAMDGYAVRFKDVRSASGATPVTVRVIADLPAGSPDNPRISAGESARIMTGAPVPDDADCIVPIEDTDQGLKVVTITRAPAAEAHIRSQGTDVRSGELVLPAGRTLGPRDLAAAAATGVRELLVHPAPRVGVLSTGSELRAAGDPLERGQLHDSNSLLLAALVEQCGGTAVQLGSVPDDNDALHALLEHHAPGLDAVVTSGGVSVGAYDVVKAVLAPLGIWFGPVRMQPGKPQGFGRWPASGTSIFTLPGNPVSVFVSFEAFVRPALLRMQGRAAVLRERIQATVVDGWRSPAGREQFMPSIVERHPDGAATVRPASERGSGSYLVASLAGANALAIVPAEVTDVRAGDLVDVTLVE